MNIYVLFEDQKARTSVLQTKLECTKSIKVPYANVVRAPPKKSGVLGKSQTLLIEATNADTNSKVLKESLQKAIKPNDLTIFIIKVRHTKKGLAITAKDEEDSKLIEAIIKENEQLRVQMVAK